jgi:5-methylcytosine-specific restriction endonuclease McrA
MKLWAKNYNKCVNCSTTDKRHMAKGLCTYCYLKQYSNTPEHTTKVKEQKHKHYLTKQKVQAKQKRDQTYFNNNREIILKRDNYKCTVCGNTGDIVHHIDGNGRNSKTPNNKLCNLTTLCRACHINTHREDVLNGRFKSGVSGWARKHENCRSCHTVKIPHNSNGFCQTCIMRQRRKLKL